MSDDDKAYYKEKAKGGEVKVARPRAAANSASSSQLYTTQGVPIAFYEEKERKEKKDLENMRKRIGSMIQQIPLMTGALLNQKQTE